MQSIHKMALITTLAVDCFAATAAHAQIGCDRACLTVYIDTYFNALIANDARPVPLASNVKITHNGPPRGGAGW